MQMCFRMVRCMLLHRRSSLFNVTRMWQIIRLMKNFAHLFGGGEMILQKKTHIKKFNLLTLDK